MTKLIERIHEGYVFGRRVKRLAHHVAEVLPPDASVLDVGCGDGAIARLIMDIRPDVTIRGIDVLIRGFTHVPVEPFDGNTLPVADKSVDAVTFIDVFHHTNDPMILLREASRVARTAVIIKDHTADGFLAIPTLRFMDTVGNARHGVVLPYNYWSKKRWNDAWRELGLAVTNWKTHLGLYPPLASLLFDRSLHFVARLEPGR